MIWQCSQCGAFTLDRKHIRVPAWAWQLACGLAGAAVGLLMMMIACHAQAATLDLDRAKPDTEEPCKR